MTLRKSTSSTEGGGKTSSRVYAVSLCRRDRPRGEGRGATLVLALVFLTAIGLIVGGLASWTANDLHDTVVFQNARSADFALNSGTQLAIQNIRYNPLLNSGQTLNASPPHIAGGAAQGPCLRVKVTTLPCGVAPSRMRRGPFRLCRRQRHVRSPSPLVYSRPARRQSLLNPRPRHCRDSYVASPGLQTVVSFNNFRANISDQCPPACGASMTIDSSTAGTIDPTVTGLATTPSTSPTEGPVTGGTALTITGTGFVSGATAVYFVDQGATPPIITTIQPANVTFGSSTSISVTTPAQTTSANYDIVVSTPSGLSPDGPQYAYIPIAPTITSITPNTGSASGGTAVTINGSGFLSNLNGDLTQVIFTDTQTGPPPITAPNLTVKLNWHRDQRHGTLHHHGDYLLRDRKDDTGWHNRPECKF